MKKLAYISAIIAMLLAVATLLTTNLLASDGESFKGFTVEYRHQQERVNQLTQQVMTFKSISSVQDRAEELGFGER